MERVPSADDFMASLWRTSNASNANAVARTPSQNEMETYFNAMLAGSASHHVGSGSFESGTPREGTPAPGGIPRVASIDFLRKMIIGNQHNFMGNGGAMSPGVAFANLASSGANLAALGLAAHGGDVGAPMAKETKGRSGAKRAGKAPPTKKAPAAKRAKAPAKAAPKAKAPVTKGKKPASAATSGTIKQAKSMTETTDDEGDYSDDGDSRDEEGNTLGGSDVRRQRRMLSNRESARRSRRRKLEHVAQLEGQIAQINAELALSMQKCRQLELRTAELVRENTTFKAENQRYLQLLQQAGPPGANVTAPKAGSSMERKSSLQRISSNGDLTKRLDSPTIGTGTGFVPFRSLQSYENLLALQAQATQGSGRTS